MCVSSTQPQESKCLWQELQYRYGFENRSSPVLSKTEKTYRFWYKNQILKCEEKPKTKRNFRFIDPFFRFIKWFLAGFLFKIQNLNENSKPVDFPVYRSVFLDFIFQNFSKIQKI
jgi:hypothetical protein